MKGNKGRKAGFVSGRAMGKAGLACAFFAFACALLVSGCAHEHEKVAPNALETVDMKALVHKEVSDPVRAGKILALLEQIDADFNKRIKANRETQQEVLRLNTDYNATPEQFKTIMERAGESRDEERARILEAYVKVKEITTPQEWEAISKVEMKPMMDFLDKAEKSTNR
jgi:hypothetical protein